MNSELEELKAKHWRLRIDQKTGFHHIAFQRDPIDTRGYGDSLHVAREYTAPRKSPTTPPLSIQQDLSVRNSHTFRVVCLNNCTRCTEATEHEFS